MVLGRHGGFGVACFLWSHGFLVLGWLSGWAYWIRCVFCKDWMSESTLVGYALWICALWYEYNIPYGIEYRKNNVTKMRMTENM